MGTDRARDAPVALPARLRQRPPASPEQGDKHHMRDVQTLTPELIGRAIDKTPLNNALKFIIAVAAGRVSSSIRSISSSCLTPCR